MAEEVGYTQFFSYIVRYQSKADASEHIIFYGAWDLKDIALSNLLPNISGNVLISQSRYELKNQRLALPAWQQTCWNLLMTPSAPKSGEVELQTAPMEAAANMAKIASGQFGR